MNTGRRWFATGALFVIPVIPAKAGIQITEGQCVTEKQPCVYIMASGRHGTLYIGVTSNLIGRILQHREGHHEGFSKRYGCVRLVWFAAADTMDAALTREKQLKKWNRDWKARLIEEDNPQWDDLAIGLGLPPFTLPDRNSSGGVLDSRLRGNDGVRM